MATAKSLEDQIRELKGLVTRQADLIESQQALLRDDDPPPTPEERIAKAMGIGTKHVNHLSWQSGSFNLGFNTARAEFRGILAP